MINHTQFLDEDGCNVIATSDVVDTISTYILQKSIFQLIKDYKAEQIETSTDTPENIFKKYIKYDADML